MKCNFAISAAMKMPINLTCQVVSIWFQMEHVLDVHWHASQTASFVPSSPTFLHFAFTRDGNSLWKGIGSFI